MDKIVKTQEYNNWIKKLKSKIHVARTKVALSINSQLLELYWEIGKDICRDRQKIIGEEN